MGRRQIDACSGQDPCMIILPFFVSLGIRSSHLEQVQSRVDRDALISTFLLGILLASWHATQEEVGGRGRTIVLSGPAAHEEQNCSLPVVRELPGPSNTQNGVITRSRYFIASLTITKYH